ncbi:MAG: M13 family metallopeptidase [Bacteroidota bacterium]
MKYLLQKSIYGIVALALLSTISCNNTDTSTQKKDTSTIPGFDLANLDTTTSPTDNFFQYATGGWQKDNPIPETESRWGSFNILYEDGQEKIKELILGAEKSKGEKGSDSQLIGDFYKSAMDSTGIEEAGLSPLQSQFDKIDALRSYKDFPDFFAKNFIEGLGSPIGFYIGIDKKDSKKYIAYTVQSGLTLPDRDYYIVDSERFEKIRTEYLGYIKNMFLLLGDEEETASKNANTVFEIEKKIAENSMSRIDRRNPELTYNKMSIDDLKKLSPDYNWNEYFKGLGINIDEVVVSQVDFLKNTNKQLIDTSIEDWKVYFKWHLVDGSASWLPNEFVKENFAFKSGVMRGVTQMKARERRAVKLVNNALGEPLGKLFVAEYFPESSKKDVEALIENLRSAYIDRVAKLDWMSEETKIKATEKLKAFTYKIGFPEEWKDYSNVEIKPNSVLENIIAVNKWDAEDNLARIGKPVDKKEWEMTPQTVNAYYNPVNNEVVFPAGILQHPFYSPETDVAINYGAIGGVIGHEFTHGFDDSGSKYDKEGNLNNWWTEEDREKFDSKTAVVVEQFDNYEPYPDVHVQGKLTLGENIADLGGLTLGYYALQKYYEINGGREDLAGFTPEQRLYLGWAQVWASNARPEYVKQQVTADPHSPAQYRVNGPMSNLQEFHEAWGAKEGDNMVRSGDLQAKIW